MDVLLNDDQMMLQDMTRRFVEDRSPIGALRKLVDGGGTIDREAWREGAGQGWVALVVPEAQGGIAESVEGLVSAAIVAEELGRAVSASPFIASATVAYAIAHSGSDAQRQSHLEGLFAGEVLGAWCFAGIAPRDGIAPAGLAIRADGDGFVIDGTAGYVEDAAVADLLLVTARGADGLTQALLPVDAPGVAVLPLDALDLGRRVAHVRFDGVRVAADAVLGVSEAADAAFEAQLQMVLALICAETVGVTERAFEFTLEWVQERYAFNRPIGSFQGLKHRLAEHAAQLEGMKAAAAHAARAVQNRAGDAAIAVSIAKSHCGRFATEIIRDCIQMHGGIGVTWDHDLHFYARRAVSNEALWGTPAVHHERLCQLAGI